MSERTRRFMSSLPALVLAACSETGGTEPDVQQAEAVVQPASSPSGTAPRRITLRTFSANPSVGAGPNSVSDVTSASYGALTNFFELAAEYTQGEVTFAVEDWAPTAPSSVLQQVGIEGDDRDAAYDIGSALDPSWGLFYLSMAPFHLGYERTLGWLYDGGGLELAQRLLDQRGLNVRVIPVLSSGAQVAGHFLAPLGQASCDGEATCESTVPVGLAGLCSSGWSLRFLPPAQHILDRACDAMVADGNIAARSLSFVSAVPGFSNLGAIQSGAVTGFEQATPMDDLATFFPAPGPAPVAAANQNPGHKGLRYVHFPAWHQPFLIGYLLLNDASVWNALTPSQRQAIERAGRDALRASFAKSEAVQCERLQALLDFNDGQPQLDAAGTPLLDAGGEPVPADLHLAQYGAADLERLQAASESYLLELAGGDEPPDPAQLEFRQVFGSILEYERRTGSSWQPPGFPARCAELQGVAP
jgi:hypothetical protein